jgi:hypothetical protein
MDCRFVSAHGRGTRRIGRKRLSTDIVLRRDLAQRFEMSLVIRHEHIREVLHGGVLRSHRRELRHLDLDRIADDQMIDEILLRVGHDLALGRRDFHLAGAFGHWQTQQDGSRNQQCSSTGAHESPPRKCAHVASLRALRRRPPTFSRCAVR